MGEYFYDHKRYSYNIRRSEIIRESGNKNEIFSPTEVGIRCSPSKVTFCENELLEINTPATAHIAITNLTNRSLDVHLEHICDFEYLLEMEPQNFLLSPFSQITVHLIITIFCTTSVEKTVTVFVDGVCTIFEFSAESDLSALLSKRDMVFHEQIGKGAFGRVYRGEYRGEDVAIKRIKINKSAQKNEQIKKELTLMSSLRSSFVVSFLGTAFTRHHTYIVMELCTLGSLTKQFKMDLLGRKLKAAIALDIAHGMRYLHANKVVHRDLKCDNVLIVSLSLGAKVRAKISDFGTSRLTLPLTLFDDNIESNGELSHERVSVHTHEIGTPVFMAPEILNKQPYSKSCDVYSYAILLLALWNEELPYEDFENKYAVFAFVAQGKRPPIPPDCVYQNVIHSCWAQNPSERSSFDGVIHDLNEIYESFAGHFRQGRLSLLQDDIPVSFSLRSTASSASSPCLEMPEKEEEEEEENDEALSPIHNQQKQRPPFPLPECAFSHSKTEQQKQSHRPLPTPPKQNCCLCESSLKHFHRPDHSQSGYFLPQTAASQISESMNRFESFQQSYHRFSLSEEKEKTSRPPLPPPLPKRVQSGSTCLAVI